LVTSDTDAPGPFVGSYPYRRSDAGMKSAILQNAKDGNTKSHSIEYEKLRHFGSLERLHQSFTLHHSSPLPSIHVISSIVLKGAESIGINLAKARAIDVGCSAGAVAFDLATKVQSVIGIDHHLENIKLAKALQSSISSKNGKNIVDEKDIYTVARSEGELVEKNRIAPLAPLPATQLEFRMADPMCLPAEMLGFDIVVVNDVLDKISSPNSLLGRLCGVRGLVRSNGLLAITSSFMWNSDITPKSLWLGGYTGPDGIQVSSLATLSDRLKNDFDLVSEINQPVFWQETCSEFKCKFLSVSLWKRK
jgi:2-polyprenyl-3-methyl-5-hydroxy-6-metoxy-1,4-benzoquinol methylase